MSGTTTSLTVTLTGITAGQYDAITKLLNGEDEQRLQNGTIASGSLTNTRGTKKAAKKEEETFGETEETEEDESDDTGTNDTAEEEAVTADQVRIACASYVKKWIAKGNSAEEGRAKVQAILKKHFKVTKVDQLNDDQLTTALSLVS